MALPNKAFLFNYNATNYDPQTHTIPKTEGQLFNEDMVLNAAASSYTSDHITVNGQQFDYDFQNVDSNPFNRSNTDSLTVIMKAKPSSLTSGAHSLFSNRGGSYNWMVFNPANGSPAGMFFLHTSDGDYNNVPSVQARNLNEPNIFAFRVSNGTGYGHSYTDNETFSTKNIIWGEITDSVHFLGGSSGDEYWSGDFYWMYCSLETLTDAEVNQVIRFNDNPGAISVNPSSLDVDYTGLTTAVTLDMESGMSWSATSVPSWVNLSATAGTDAASITVVVSRNNNTQPRTGIVVFEDSEENTAELLINQAKHPAIVPVNNLYLGDKLVD